MPEHISPKEFDAMVKQYEANTGLSWSLCEDSDQEIAIDMWLSARAYYLKKENLISETPINDIAKKHFEWVKSMGWGGNEKTILEELMLVVSECGEAANEVRGKKPTENFKYEIADIILRAMAISVKQDINLDGAIRGKMRLNELNGKKEERNS